MIIYHASLNLNASGKNQKATLATVKWTYHYTAGFMPQEQAKHVLICLSEL